MQANSMCWPKAKAGKPKRRPFDANGWRGCCANCAGCGTACPSAISCYCASALPRKKPDERLGFVTIRVPQADEEVTRQTFTFATNKNRLRQAEQRDGHYLLRSNLTGEDPAALWERYVQLTQIEAAFKSMKSELGLRPIY